MIRLEIGAPDRLADRPFLAAALATSNSLSNHAPHPLGRSSPQGRRRLSHHQARAVHWWLRAASHGLPAHTGWVVRCVPLAGAQLAGFFGFGVEGVGCWLPAQLRAQLTEWAPAGAQLTGLFVFRIDWDGAAGGVIRELMRTGVHGERGLFCDLLQSFASEQLTLSSVGGMMGHHPSQRRRSHSWRA